MFKVDGWNNFCRVFELPESYPHDYCFSGGLPVNFMMVDWFNPIPGMGQPAVSKEVWRKEVGEIETEETTIKELSENLVPWLMHKYYVRKGRDYLILFDFGAALRFTGN